MSWHLHGTIVTDQGTAGNNRGDSEGNKSTLQKIFRNGEQYTTVSAEAIRYALREGLHGHDERDRDGERYLKLESERIAIKEELNAKPAKASPKTSKQSGSEGVEPDDEGKKAKKRQKLEKDLAKIKSDLAGLKLTPKAIRLNRTMPDHKSNEWHDKQFNHWKEFLDDDALGFMYAKSETESHRGILEISRAISTTPWRGEVVMNYASPGSNPGVSHADPIPYAIEVHHTRYQYTFTMTPGAFAQDQFLRTKWLLTGLLNLRRVGGNHAHFLFDFVPAAIVLRWTHDPAPRIMYCFDEREDGELSLRRLRDRVVLRDIVPEADENNSRDRLYIGTVAELADAPDGHWNASYGPVVAVDAVIKQIEKDLGRNERTPR